MSRLVEGKSWPDKSMKSVIDRLYSHIHLTTGQTYRLSSMTIDTYLHTYIHTYIHTNPFKALRIRLKEGAYYPYGKSQDLCDNSGDRN